ncbi:MAG: PorT family protein [Prevotella sp.]|nr:PorT family protein [Prevotella sp.]
MKKIVFASILMCFSITILAQQPVGKLSVIPKVGVNLATLTKFDYAKPTTDGIQTIKPASSKMKAGLTAGLEAEYQLTNKTALVAGLLYSMQGVGYDDHVYALPENHFQGVSRFRLNLQYINIPILAREYLFKGFAITAGIQPGVFLEGRAKSEGSQWHIADNGKTVYDSSEEVNSKWNSVFKKFDLSIPLAISYEWENVIMEARYNFGLIKIFKNNLFNSENRVLTFSVGYRL